MAVTPETGAEPATPERGTGLMSEEQAVEQIARMLSAEQAPENEPEPEPQPQPEEEPSQEAAEEAQETEEPTEEQETDETEPEAEAEELPDTLQGLADALGMSPDDLAEHVKVPVKVNGKTWEVTIGEAIRGHQREQDYSRRTNEVADERRKMAEEKAAYEQQRQHALQEVGQLATALKQRVDGISDDLMAQVLREEGQEAYLQLDMQRRRDRELLQQVQNQHQKLVAEQSEHLAEFRREQQSELVKLIPDFGDPAKGRQKQDALATYLEGRGFSQKEVSDYFDGPFDARYIAVLDDAAKYRELMAKSKKVGKTIKRQSKPRKGGTVEDHKPPSKLTSLRQQVRESRYGSRDQQREAGVALISGILRGE